MIIKTDPDIIKSYFEDYSGLLGGHADKVILPEDEKETRDCLLEASAKKVPVTISGGGTGVTGARIPFGGWVIATDTSVLDRECPEGCSGMWIEALNRSPVQASQRHGADRA